MKVSSPPHVGPKENPDRLWKYFQSLVYERDAGIFRKLNALKVTRYSIGTASLHRSVQFRVF